MNVKGLRIGDLNDRTTRDGIAKRIVVAILLFSLVITTVITAIELYDDYRDGVHAIDARADFIGKNFLPALVESMWVNDEMQINTQLRALSQFPEIEFVMISVDGKPRWTAGNRTSKRQITHSVALERTHRDGKVRIGTLEIVGSVDAVLARIYNRLLLVLAENLLKTILVAVFALAVFHRLVTRHLTTLSKYAHSIDPSSMRAEEVSLDRPQQGWGRPDVLDDLAGAMNGMRRRQAEATEELRAMNETLERRVRERTAELEASVRDLESFSYSVSHDLRAPLRAMNGFAKMMMDSSAEPLSETQRQFVTRIAAAAYRMSGLIDGLLQLGRVARQDMQKQAVDFSVMAADVIAELRESDPANAAEISVQAGIVCRGDRALLRVVMSNLLANAWKFVAKSPAPAIHVGMETRDGERVYYVRDNGAGFDMAYIAQLFKPFQRLHSATEYEGTGIGLATVARIIERHGGRIWAEAVPGQGASFYFTLG